MYFIHLDQIDKIWSSFLGFKTRKIMCKTKYGCFPQNHDNSFGALIWKASKIYNDIKLCKESKTITVVDIWLNSLMNLSFSPPFCVSVKVDIKMYFFHHIIFFFVQKTIDFQKWIISLPFKKLSFSLYVVQCPK